MRAHVATAMGALLLVVAVAACGDDDGEVGSTTTVAADTTTTTTTAAEGSTTTTVTGTDLGDEPAFHDDGPSGSGCTAGTDELPDGWWYGDLIVPPGEGLAFDLACYYVGPAAEAEAASRGEEVNNDYYVVDDNPVDRSITIAAGATASCVDLSGSLMMVDCTPPDVAGDWNVWIRVVGGQVDRIVEQYAP
jgi:hypothetical protein